MAARCPLCGSSGAQCGPRAASSTQPVDALEEVPTMTGPLRVYVVRQSSGIDATLKLSEADAERLGGRPVDAEPTPAPTAAPARRKARTARNKARQADATKADG